MVLGSRAAMGYVLGRDAGTAAVAWWLSGGVSAANCVAAYQPIGAASLAASYSNLANPGTYTAAPGTAPTWAAATGWTFNGLTQYLTTGIPYAGNQTWSAIVRFTATSPNTNNPLIGNSAAPTNIVIASKWGVSTYLIGQANKFLAPSGAPASGVLAMAGTSAYLDGSSLGTIAAGTVTNSVDIYIARFPNAAAYGNASIQAVAIYNTTLSAAQVAAISTAMSGL